MADARYGTDAPAADAAKTVMSPGSVSVGAVVSCTVTSKDPLLVLPWASVAEHVTVVSPSGNASPEVASQSGVTEPSTASLALAPNVTAAPVDPVASTVMSPGSVSVGAVVSCTVTSNDPLLVLPWASVAEHVTVVSPSGTSPRRSRRSPA